ncbi:glutathione peroxidase [Streptococcus parauberis]|uniref:glutathione peroxidase n=1 Tax=Streptococcus parauberis TaxID=1348 RepID=UPI000789BEDA|nr:glutathione peroxidase [Streptococcus parauberis]KYP16923.1 Hydroperoxy fatty acid reductase gpx1 [Streptococcus parauberis]KYP18278.1 Hydroperoxy fatty acid reductase gpx1 [Streptococcus parauberis]KYP20487.1 Hydroperoxy fatty acid reductase gpx1 [Streptococcus parauberis]KYP24673.1 Hydroperoxy fatty acid reductase gpx1 [Streptococcus parauberis]KYP27052.1 Hydroperoxy fatty acid reductase gpx1 [Streptococcus parauberis]
MTSLYDFTVKDQHGEDISLSQFQGKVLLIVNTATGCGLTPQYQGLQELYDQYVDKGFVILDFPCNQFAGQAPGNAEEINDFCSLNYQTTFPRFAKVNVNGKEADQMYVWLKSQKKGLLGKAIEWNFAKFLIDKNGQVVKRYSSKTAPQEIRQDLEVLLKD